MVVVVVITELQSKVALESSDMVYTDESIAEINSYLADVDNLWSGESFRQLFSTDMNDMAFKAYTKVF